MNPKWLPLLAGVCLFTGAARADLSEALATLDHDLSRETGVYVLEKGEESLIARAWLTENARSSIDIQYFIWSTDNIGTLAAEALLRAAQRGVRVRVIVDDLLVDAAEETLLALDRHPNVAIKIYNPRHSVGVNTLSRLFYLLAAFKHSNQRMHDKTAIFDNAVGVTGGRNMADEYYDFDREYTFRDRDVVLIGAASQQMSQNFESFWQSPLAHRISDIFIERGDRLSSAKEQAIIQALHDYARDDENFEPAVRTAIAQLPSRFPLLKQKLVWENVQFISDQPGKNERRFSLSGGGESTSSLINAVSAAQHSIVIQSPYLVLPDGGLQLFRDKIAQGVSIRILTNSLASTDNLPAFSGYSKIRSALLDAGVELYEFKPDAASRDNLVVRRFDDQPEPPKFGLHAKTLVVDSKTTYIGTFNLDPRSANLNTEVGALIESQTLAQQVEAAITQDMRADSAWHVTSTYNPDQHASWLKRLKVLGMRLLPMDAIL